MQHARVGRNYVYGFFDGVRFPLDYMGWYMDTCIEDDALKYPEEGVDEHLLRTRTISKQV